MLESEFLAIGVSIRTRTGVPIDVLDLSPIVRTTKDLLDCANHEGVCISPSSVGRGHHSLTLASIDGVVVLIDCMCEETSDAAQTRKLVQLRRKELAHVFAEVMNDVTPPSQKYAQSPQATTALFLMAAAFKSAQLLVSEGVERQEYPKHTFEAAYVRVVPTASGLRFETAPRSLAAPASKILH